MLLRVLRNWGGVCLAVLFLQQASVCGSEADLKIPDLRTVSFNAQGTNITGLALMYGGLVVCLLGVVFGLLQYKQTGASRSSFFRSNSIPWTLRRLAQTALQPKSRHPWTWSFNPRRTPIRSPFHRRSRKPGWSRKFSKAFPRWPSRPRR